MRKSVVEILNKLEKSVDKPWFLPVSALLAGADNFLFLIPVDGIMFSALLLKPKRWFWFALWFALGTGLGAAIFDIALDYTGMDMIQNSLRKVISPGMFEQANDFFINYGIWAMTLIALGPFPVQPMILIAALSPINTLTITLSIFGGRFLKNLILCYVGSRAPDQIARLMKKDKPSS